MKNLVLSAMVAAMATQAAACIIVDDDEPSGNRIAVTWNYKVNGVTQNGCPAGAVGVDLLIQPTGASAPTIYEYNCGDSTMIEYVRDGQYQIWVELVTSSGATYAQSLSVIDNVVGEDKDITVDIHEDRGFFFAAWSLKGASSQASLACNQVPDLQSISLLATPVGTGARIDTFMDCGPGAGASKALQVGEYTLSLDAVNSANQALGTAGIALRQPIGDRNQVTNLGSVIIPIDGQ